MEIASNIPVPTKAGHTSANTKVSSDFDTFLKMLTTQIQNQDPLNPIDSADFAVQLATFASVEQQTLTNQKLDALTGSMNIQRMAQLAPWVGNEVRSTAPVYMDRAPVTLTLAPKAGADQTVLVVTDQNGTVVSREDIPTAHKTHLWTGTDITGAPLPTGAYSLSLESYQGGVQLGTSSVESYARIQEIQNGASGLNIIVNGGIAISEDQITALRNPT